MKLIHFRSDWTPDTDFYELNPQIKLFPQFKGMTGDEGWAVFFYNEPDESLNKLYRLTPEERKKAIIEYFPDIEWENVEKFSQSYLTYGMSSVKRSYKDMLDTISQRTEFLKNTPYDLETVKILDDAHLKTSKIFDQYQEVYEKFIEEKESARVKGGRKLSKAERKDI